MIGLTLAACLAGWFASKGFGKLEDRLFPMYSQPYSASSVADPHAHQEEPESAALNPTPGIDAAAEKQYMLTQMGDMPKELKELILTQAQYRVNINELTEHPGVFYSAHHFMLGAAHAWEDWMKKCRQYPEVAHVVSGKEISDYLTKVCNPRIEDALDLAGAKYLSPKQSIERIYTVEKEPKLVARDMGYLNDAVYSNLSPLQMNPGDGAEGFTLRPFNGDTDHAEWLNGYFLITRIAGLEDPAAASQQRG